MMIQTTKVGVKPTVRIHSAIADRTLPYWRRRLSRDVNSIRDHSHGTACGASMAIIRAYRGMYAYGRMNADQGLCMIMAPRIRLGSHNSLKLRKYHSECVDALH